MQECSQNKNFDSNYYKGDDFGSFGGTGITIDAVNIPEGFIISKAELRIGPIIEVFEKPEFPLIWTPDEETTSLLDYANDVYLAVYDEDGRKRTCEGHFTFIVKDKVV